MVGLDTLAMLAALSPRQREALVDTAYLGQTLKEVGARMGCGPERVRQLRKQAQDRLAVYRDTLG